MPEFEANSKLSEQAKRMRLYAVRATLCTGQIGARGYGQMQFYTHLYTMRVRFACAQTSKDLI